MPSVTYTPAVSVAADYNITGTFTYLLVLNCNAVPALFLLIFILFSLFVLLILNG